MKRRGCVMIVAGEASGDHHGAKLVRSMLAKAPDLFFCGIGGPALREAGVRILVESDSVSVIGITEMFGKLAQQVRSLVLTRRLLRTLRPDLLILIDFPEFNLRVAPTAKKLGIPVLYYISPQLWAWRSGRVEQVRRFVDRMAVILPFEEKFYRHHRVPVRFVGHPLLDNDLPAAQALLRKAPDGPPILGLLPGSRDKEIQRHLPVMLSAAHRLRRRIPGMELMISLAPSVDLHSIAPLLRRYNALEKVERRIGAIFERSTVAIAASGTVTLEAALHGLPLVIVYKVSPPELPAGPHPYQGAPCGTCQLDCGT